MDDHGKLTAAPLHLDRLGPPAEDLHLLGEHQLPGDGRAGVVVAPDDEGADARFREPPQLLRQEAGSLHRRLVAVIKIASQEQRIDLLVEAKIDDADEGMPRGIADQ
jgi:hypothetical protein